MLIGNGRLTDKIPMTFLGRDWNAQIQPTSMPATTWLDNFGALAAMPDGYYQPQGWSLPRKAGRIAARNNTALTVTGGGLAVGGITADASASFTVSVADAAGELITFGTGAATVNISTNSPLLTASLNAVGTGSFAITAANALLGAEASLTGAANISVAGALTPYAIGNMSGSTVDAGTLTTASILAAMNADPPAVNIARVNGYPVQGDGQAGSEWRPA